MSTTSLSPYSIAEPLSPPIAAVPKHRNRKRILIALTGILVISLTAVLSFYGYIAWWLARPNVEPLYSNPMQAIQLPYEDVLFSSMNGETQLEGWLIPANSTKAVVFSHGYGANREEVWVPLYALAKELYNDGFNVLMFDYSYVRSDGEYLMTAGFEESKELLGAVRFLKDRGLDHVTIWGFSMGAGTALQAALHATDIDAMILDSSFILNPDTLYHNIQQIIDVPKFPTIPLVQFFSKLLNGVGMHEIPYEQVLAANYEMPIMLIHGDHDNRAPYELVEQIADHQQHPLSQLWIVPGGEHELIYQTQPEAYLQHAFAFLDAVSEDMKSD